MIIEMLEIYTIINS